jgi:hypothetical protein
MVPAIRKTKIPHESQDTASTTAELKESNAAPGQPRFLKRLFNCRIAN